MRALSLALAGLLLAACATERPLATPPTASAEPGIFRAAELARVRCLLVTPFENASNAPYAAGAATGALLAGVSATGTRVFPVKELREIFRDTPIELPEGVPPALAMELAQLVGADAAIYGTVEGRDAGGPAGLIVSLRLALSPSRELLYASTFAVSPRPGESIESAVRRSLAEATHEMFLRLGGFRGGTCFDRKRLEELRALALEQGAAKLAAAPAAAAPPPPPPAPAAKPTPAPPPRPAAFTQRQRDWSRLLAERQSFLVEDVGFAGRTSQLQRDSGLADLAIALAATPDARVAIEGHVDATTDAVEDSRLSLAMAQAAVDRLVELGVARGRLQVVARGSDSPRLPNFTVRGRAANRRIEAVGLK
jgi:outer membrane protein OmpA-like peptidoglycan-associated protein